MLHIYTTTIVHLYTHIASQSCKHREIWTCSVSGGPEVPLETFNQSQIGCVLPMHIFFTFEALSLLNGRRFRVGIMGKLHLTRLTCICRRDIQLSPSWYVSKMLLLIYLKSKLFTLWYIPDVLSTHFMLYSLTDK